MYRDNFLFVQFNSTNIRKFSFLTKSLKVFSAIIASLLVAGFFLISSSFIPANAFTHNFLYKFGSFWSDVTTDGAFLYVANSAYSQIDKYNVAGVHQTSNWGGYGSTLGKLNQPMGIVRVGTNLYVADTGNHRIERFDSSTGVADKSWGSYGASSGQFNSPQGVAVDSAQSYLFVADTANNRIQAIELAGDTVASVAGTLGNGENQFSSPKGIAVTGTAPSFTVYVADTGNNRVIQYTFNTGSKVFNKVYLGVIGSYGVSNGQFNQPNKVTVDSVAAGSNLYVTDTTSRIQKFDNGRNFLSSWIVHDSKGTTGLTSYDSGGGAVTLYVVEPYHQIDSYNAQTTVYSASFTDESNQPVDVSIDTNDNIYINNSTTNTVEKFSSSWAPMAEWGGNGGAFNGAMGIGVNTGGEVCVADTGNNRIERFDTSGTYMTTLPTPLVTPVGFSSPKDIAMESTGKMYIADTTNNRILKYKSDNTPDWAIGLPTPTPSIGPGTPTPVAPTGPYFLNPYGITVDSQNKIYVADSGYNRIQKFDANGNIERAWGQYGSADNLPEPQFDNPQGMAIETTGSLTEYYIYVADTGNNRIQRFNQDGTKDPTQDVWGVYGTGDGQFNQPRGITLDSSKRVYVSEAAGKRIQVFGDASLNAGLTIVETGSTAVTEDGSVIDSYSVKLKSQPSATVTVNIASSDSTQLTVSSSSLTFTPYNWNIPQVVTVLPVHDFIDQTATQTLTLNHTTSSTDANYNSGVNVVASVQVTLTDTDTSGLTFSKTSVNVAEAGATDTFTIALNSKPTADVTITMDSTDGQTTGNGVNPTPLTFTSANWSTPQSIIVSAVHDFIANGSRDSFPTFSATTTDTSGYQAVTFPSFVAHITDATDIAGVTLSAATISLTEGGASGTFSIYLNSKPSANVTITPTYSATQLTVSPTVLTFTPLNYNTAQVVTVSAINDLIVNGITAQRDVDITYASASTDPKYAPGVTFTGGTSGNIMRVVVTDINVAGVAFSKGSTAVTEGVTTDSFTISLMSKPSGTVILTSSYPAGFEATTSAYIHIFTTANWNVPQIATISAANNNIYEGTHSATLSHAIAISADPNFAVGPLAQGILTTIYDTDYPGININLPNNVLNVTEGGASDLFYVKLKTQPLNDVTITMSGGSDLTTSPTSLTFTTANWGAYQIATVSAINNFIVQGPHTGTLTYLATSSDAGYNGIQTLLTVNIADDDNTVPGVQITQTDGGTTVTEGGNKDSYTLVLTSKPTASVKIKVLGNNWEATSSGAIYNFSTTNWNVPQTVGVEAIDDAAIDGTRTTIFHHIVTSADPHYNYIAVDDVTITVNDNDATSPASAPTCNQTPPYDRPNLFQINTTQNSATLYYTPIRDNISYYYVAYDKKAGGISYGVSFDYGSYDGVIDYTIYALQPSTRYYFKIRGGNGCATGPWGNEMSAVTAASGSASTYVSYAPASSYATTSGSSGTTSGGSSGGSATHPQFTRNFYIGTTGADVRSLQMYLNQQGFLVAQSGPGSPGNETVIYGPLTANAVRRFQEAHYQEILSPLGYSSGTGIFGPSTRAYVNSH